MSQKRLLFPWKSFRLRLLLLGSKKVLLGAPPTVQYRSYVYVSYMGTVMVCFFFHSVHFYLCTLVKIKSKLCYFMFTLFIFKAIWLLCFIHYQRRFVICDLFCIPLCPSMRPFPSIPPIPHQYCFVGNNSKLNQFSYYSIIPQILQKSWQNGKIMQNGNSNILNRLQR